MSRKYGFYYIDGMKTLMVLIQTVLMTAVLSSADVITCSPVSSELAIGAVPPITVAGAYSTKECKITLDTETGRVSASCGVSLIGVNFYDRHFRLIGAYRVDAETGAIPETPRSYSRCTAAMKPDFSRGSVDTSMIICAKGSFRYVINDSSSDIPVCIDRSPDGYDAVIARGDELPEGYISDSTRAIPVFPGVYAVCGGVAKEWHTNTDGTKECVNHAISE